MSFFKDIEGDGAVIVEKGVFKQVGLAIRDGYVFARVGGGYIRLMMDGSTSKANVSLDYLSWEGELRRDAYGRLCSPDVNGSKALEPAKAQKLLGGSIEA